MTDSGKHVLVIEEAQTMQKFIVSVLESEGFEVTVAENGFKARNLIRAREFDLVIVSPDQEMINGLEYVHQVRTRSKTPIILLTTEGKEETRDRGMQRGATGYINKHCGPEELVSAVRRWMTPAPDDK